MAEPTEININFAERTQFGVGRRPFGSAATVEA